MLLIDSFKQTMSNCVEKATAFFDKKLVTAPGQYYRYYIIEEQGHAVIVTPERRYKSNPQNFQNPIRLMHKTWNFAKAH